ncbi:chromosome partitioning protein [Oceanicella actignis]|uniref:Chromosome partitioning protein ParA n=2 Tax=Oceanicella actignis TaxID=1189325 RepID=A0A1M7T299_9RHOB|nr:chromosome partitioning protein [Oceanicella actignis]SET38851.1 chromosome partitioning protein [Oceanicella actignis]SHN64873.1 chromosome partitioning protein [Oceanicella actignis]
MSSTPDQPLMSDARRILAIANQKGGVGKTTTAINLAAALVETGRKVLLIDLDPQGNASTGLGIDADRRVKTAYDVLIADDPLRDAIQRTDLERLDIVPATVDLSSADVAMVSDKRRNRRLRDALAAAEIARDYDHVVIDCPPSLNLLTINAMGAADAVLVPLQCEFFAMEGLSQLLKTVKQVRRSLNPDLKIEGVILTMFDRRNNLSQMVAEDVRRNLGDLVYRTVIPRNVRLSEAPSYAAPITVYDSASRGSLAYRALAREFIERQALAAA